MGKANAKIILDKEGKEYTLSEVAVLVGRHLSTVWTWVSRQGVMTLEECYEKATACKLQNKNNYAVYDTMYGNMTCSQIATKAGTTSSCVYSRGTKYGWDSEVVFWPSMHRSVFDNKLKALGLYKKPKASKAIYTRFIYDEERGEKIPYVEAAKRLKVSVDRVAKWIHINACKTYADCLAYKNHLAGWKKAKGKDAKAAVGRFIPPSSLGDAIIDVSEGFGVFDRRKHCYRNDFMEICEYYNECQDVRIFSMQHSERYEVDGSCYTGEVVEVLRRGSSGQVPIRRLDNTERL